MLGSHLISVTPTISASPDYESGDAIGGLMSVMTPYPSRPWYLNYVSIASKVDLSVAVSLIIFNGNPSASTFTDNGALSIHANDYDKIQDVVAFAAGDWIDLGTPEVQTIRNLNIPILPTAGIFYAALLSGGAINAGSTSDLTVRFGLIGE